MRQRVRRYLSRPCRSIKGLRTAFRDRPVRQEPELRGISGQDEYADGMVEHDMHIGKFLKVLDELGIADNTIVFYSTDNGPHLGSKANVGDAR